MVVELEPKLILFLSVDVVGSTAYKNRHVEKDRIQPWLPLFKDFYRDFPLSFNDVCNEEKKVSDFSNVIRENDIYPAIWKSLGDELIFYIKLDHYKKAEFYVLCFKKTIERYSKIIKKKELEDLGLKATAWLAGFPVINAEIEIDSEKGVVDFIGPLIDIGFRLSKFASEQKFVISVDLVLMLSYQTPGDYRIYYDGMVQLKGVLDNKFYPIIWLDMFNDNNRIDSGIKLKCEKEELQKFCKQYIKETGRPIIKPFIEHDEIFHEKPENYDKDLEELRKFSYEGNLPEKSAEEKPTLTNSNFAENLLGRLKILYKGKK